MFGEVGNSDNKIVQIVCILTSRKIGNSYDIKVINSSIEKASIKEKENRCDFCFLREKDIIKCIVIIPSLRIAIFTLIQLVFQEPPKFKRG